MSPEADKESESLKEVIQDIHRSEKESETKLTAWDDSRKERRQRLSSNSKPTLTQWLHSSQDKFPGRSTVFLIQSLQGLRNLYVTSMCNFSKTKDMLILFTTTRAITWRRTLFVEETRKGRNKTWTRQRQRKHDWRHKTKEDDKERERERERNVLMVILRSQSRQKKESYKIPLRLAMIII